MVVSLLLSVLYPGGRNRHGVEAGWGVGNDGSPELIFQKKYLFDKFS